jgi:3-hydroxybutyrate dehydrogenase
MSNKVAMITGATGGIGLGIAHKLAKSNTNLIINGFASESEIEDVVSDLEKYNIKCIYHNCDVIYPESVNEMIQTGIKHFGRIDILINNAGIQYVENIEDFPVQKWEEIIKVNLFSAFYTIKAITPFMKQNNWGRIINIASAHGLVGSPYKSAYVASKHGMIGLTKSCALELAKFGVTVNAICPGYVKTNLVMNQLADTAKVSNLSEEQVMNEVILKSHAIKSLIDIDDVAHLVAVLCDEKAKSITGSALTIDAGWTAQ